MPVITSAGAIAEPRRIEPTGQRRRARRPTRPARLSAMAHVPSRAMPTGVMWYFAGSAARSTWAAVVQLTSCSADWPPNNTTSLIRSPGRHAAPTVPCAAMRFRASDVAAATGGRLVGPDVDDRRRRLRHPHAAPRPAVRAAGRRPRRARVHRRLRSPPVRPRTSRPGRRAAARPSRSATRCRR